MGVVRMGSRRSARHRRHASALALAGATIMLACAALASGAPPSVQVAFIGALAGPEPTVMITGLSGSGTRALGPGSDARIAPDGTSVAAGRSVGTGPQAGYEVLLYSTTSHRVRTLLHATGSPPDPLAWSPDSRYLAVVEFNRLVVVDTRTGVVRTIATGQVTAASFAPRSGDRLVFDRSALNSSAVNVFVADPDGRRQRRLTDDGLSEFPLWGPRDIVFTRETIRDGQSGPLYELWSIEPDGSGARQLTHVAATKLNDGLTAVAFSADGKRLLANFEGTDTLEAWVVDLSGPVALPRDLTAKGNGTIGVGLSRDGDSVLAEDGYAGDTPANWGIETIPWRGGRATPLVRRGAFPSWDD
jgi:Tol biopolymer transport system component